MRQPELGIHDILVDHGDHLCGLHLGARPRDELVIPFLDAGLRQTPDELLGIEEGGTDPRSDEREEAAECCAATTGST